MQNKGWRAYEPNIIEFFNSSNISVSSGDITKGNIVNPNRFLSWKSLGSDDTTTETITITLPTPQTINNIFLIGHNFKDFEITYNGGNAFNFLSDSIAPSGNGIVSGILVDDAGNPLVDDTDSNLTYATLKPSLQGLIEGLEEDAYQAEFSPLSIRSIEITVTKTQIADAEKYLEYLIFTNEIGREKHCNSVAYPEMTFSNNETKSTGFNNKSFIQKKQNTMVRARVSIDLYRELKEEFAFYTSLIERQEPFLVWFGAGFLDVDFGIRTQGLRVGDIYKVQLTGDYNYQHTADLYRNGVKFKLTMIEVN